MRKDENAKLVLTIFVFAFSFFLFFVIKEIVFSLFIKGLWHGWMYTFAHCFASLFSGRCANLNCP